MKNLKLVFFLTLLLTFIVVVRCSKSSDPAPLVGISGTVTYTDMNGVVQKAAGAVVYIAKGTAATTTYDESTTAGSDGTYSFSNLANAGYYINAVYNTDNKNSSARIDGVKFTTAKGFLVTLASKALTQDIALESIGQATAQNVQVSYQFDSTANSNAGGFTNTGAWTLDAVHSPIAFSFPFFGQTGDFGGSFLVYNKVKLNINTASLNTSSVSAWVDLASVNTGTPGGRDDLPYTTSTTYSSITPSSKFSKLGCISNTFGIAADSAAGYKHTTLTSSARYAKFSSTSVATYGDGYVANGNLTFHGVTKAASIIFNFTQSYPTGASGFPANKTYVGIQGKMVMNAQADYGISSSDVGASPVTVYISLNVYQ